MNIRPIVMTAMLLACGRSSVPPGSAPVNVSAADVEQRDDGDGPAPRIVASFDGLGIGFDGPQGAGRSGNPSDNSIAVGPDHIMQTVNSRMAIFTKKGSKYDTTGRVLYGSVPTNNVFRGFGGDCEARNNGDAVVRYDQLADRWLIVMPIFSRIPYRADQPTGTRPSDPAAVSVVGVAGQPGAAAPLHQPPPPDPSTQSVPPGGRGGGGRGAAPTVPKGVYSICYAISTTADRLGSYNRYEFLRPYFPDYPRPAIWPDGYYVPSSTGDDRISATVATQKHACVVERAKMLRGEPATEQCVIIENVNFLNNADLDGKSQPPPTVSNIMIAAGGTQLDSVFRDSVLRVWKFHVDWRDPSRTRVTESDPIRVAPYQYLCNGQLTNCVPQPGTDRRLDAQGDKIMARVVYRRIGDQQSIVAVHSVNTVGGGGGVRWYELRVEGTSVRLHQQGTYRAGEKYRWMASPAMDRFGNIGIGYSFGSAADFPGQRFAGRRPSDRPGRLNLREAVLAQGEGAQESTLRWEDYTQTAVDPSDDCTIWYVGDYLKAGATAFSTRIGAFRMPDCR